MNREQLAAATKERHEEVREHAATQQAATKKRYDHSHPAAPASLGIGRLVSLETDRAQFPGASKKLAPINKGPYKVVKVLSHLNRVIQSTNNELDVHIVHVSQIGEWKERRPHLQVQDASKECSKEKEVAEILEKRAVDGKVQYKVRWKNHTAKGDSWVTKTDLHAPDLLRRFERRPTEAKAAPLPVKRRTQAERAAATPAKGKTRVHFKEPLVEAKKLQDSPLDRATPSKKAEKENQAPPTLDEETLLRKSQRPRKTEAQEEAQDGMRRSQRQRKQSRSREDPD